MFKKEREKKTKKTKLHQSLYLDPYHKLVGSNPADKPPNIWKMEGTQKIVPEHHKVPVIYHSTVKLIYI